MSGPPKTMGATELWTQIMQSPRPHRVVDFPRKGADGQPIGQVAIRVLTQQEQIVSELTAEKMIRKELGDAKNSSTSPGYDISYLSVCSVEQLWRAVRDPVNVDVPAFPSPKDMRTALTVDEIAVLYQQFMIVRAELGPIISRLTPEEVDAWVARLTEGGSTDALSFFSLEAHQALVRGLVSAIQKSSTRPGSPGSPPDDIGSDTSSDDEALT